jgi:putative membrane protein
MSSEPDDGATPRRWPRRVYDTGEEPDPRFTFANERTFLAWIRTALALVAAGIALEALEVPTQSGLRLVLVLVLAVLGGISSLVAFVRWAGAERALRESRPLPAPSLAPVLALGLGVAALVIVVALIAD